MVKPLTKSEIITAGDIGNLSTSLVNKAFVHSLPTQLLLRSHNRIELQHLENPKDKRLQIAHTNLFLEMELREIEHFDTDPNFFTPSNTKWPFEFEFDENVIIEKFRKKIKTINIRKRTIKGKEPKQKRFKRLDTSTKIRIRRGSKRKLFKEVIINPQPTKKTVHETIKRISKLELHSEALDFATLLLDSTESRRIFKEKAVATWNIQPDSGNIPIANGPRPKKEHWFKTLFPPLGAYQAFMQKTLNAFYRKQTPPWAIQEWDIKLTVTNSGGDDTIEKRNFIQTKIDPN